MSRVETLRVAILAVIDSPADNKTKIKVLEYLFELLADAKKEDNT